MAVVIVGDVGPIAGNYHAGDEGMLAAAIDELRARGVEDFTVVSASPEDTAHRYGVATLRSLSAGASSTSRTHLERSRTEILSAAAGHSSVFRSSDSVTALIDAIAGSDGVLISGGGNLTSLWPEHIYERSVIAALARQFRKPVVFSGQMVGPHLLGRDGVLLSEMLGQADLVGVRDAASRRIAIDLGVDAPRLQLGLDDAMFLRGSEVASRGREYCVVTVAPYSGAVAPELLIERLAATLDAVVDLTGLELVLVPHQGDLGGDRAHGDPAALDMLAGALSHPSVMMPISDVRAIASTTRAASLSVSTRYHPVVFASSAAIPAVGIALDGYTHSKIAGALENVGLADGTLSSMSLASSTAERAIAMIWQKRDSIRSHLEQVLPSAQAHQQAWWDRVAGALGGVPVRPVQDWTWRPLPLLDSPLRSEVGLQARWHLSESNSYIAARLAGTDEADESSLAADVTVAELQALLGATELRVQELELALTAAHELAAAVAEPLYVERLSPRVITPVPDHLRAMLNSRTSRAALLAGRIYRAGRSRLRRLRRH